MANYICTYCQSPIKNSSELYVCPKCTSYYHKDCWVENEGCAVYGCGFKDTSIKSTDDTKKDAVVDVEYLINNNKFTDALVLARTTLKLDESNTELKALYNKAVSLINNKLKLFESGDQAFFDRDFSAAEIYYTNAIDFADENEKTLLETKLEVIRQKIPQQRHQKVIKNILTTFLLLVILSSAGYFAYYYFVLEEDREYANIERNENLNDPASMELQIPKYERFLLKYKNGRNYEKAQEKYSLLCYDLAKDLLRDDWREALKYLNKIIYGADSKAVKDVYKEIIAEAKNEIDSKMQKARQLNNARKYSEAKTESEGIIAIMQIFPDDVISKNSGKVRNNINLLDKKISFLIRSRELEKEITENQEKLNHIIEPAKTNSIEITGKIYDIIDNSSYAVKLLYTGKIIAVSTIRNNYGMGEILSVSCKNAGSMDVFVEGEMLTVPAYAEIKDYEKGDFFGLGLSDRESIAQRLKYLNQQKAKVDSVLSVSI
ncbi:hypothetical protein BH10BAC5_BH10BAC5_18080 [soil metagenome]